MPACAICLGADPDDERGRYHSACLERLFGTQRCPEIDLDLRGLPERVRTTHDRMSVSGAQRKALLHLAPDRARLLLAQTESSYILKPQTERFPRLPENEHVSMCIAAGLGLRAPLFGLIWLTDDSLAYVVRRFDRSDDVPPQKRDQWDLCQLLGRAPEAKALGNAEECAALVRRMTVAPRRSLQQLFLLFLCSYWIGNGDLHLKNISLLDDSDGEIHLSPVYDLVCTTMYRIDHQLLRIAGRTDDLQWTHFVQFGTGACGLERADVLAMIEGLRAYEAEARGLVERSLLPENDKHVYKQTLRRRARALRAPSPTGAKRPAS